MSFNEKNVGTDRSLDQRRGESATDWILRVNAARRAAGEPLCFDESSPAFAKSSRKLEKKAAKRIAKAERQITKLRRDLAGAGRPLHYDGTSDDEKLDQILRLLQQVMSIFSTPDAQPGAIASAQKGT